MWTEAAVLRHARNLSTEAALFDWPGPQWKATFDTQIGTQNYTYEFHVDGNKVTGTATNDRGSTPITEGKLDGDTITFVEAFSFNGNDIRIEYTGKISGDQIKFTRKVGEFATEQLVAERSK